MISKIDIGIHWLSPKIPISILQTLKACPAPDFVFTFSDYGIFVIVTRAF